MKLRPIGDHIIVKAVTSEEVSKSGIIIPETVEKEQPERGEVVAVGPGKELENGNRSTMDVKEGDQVVFKKWGPDKVKIGDEEFLVIRSEDVMAVIEA